MALSGIVVALMETGLIFYSGRVIDLLGANDPGRPLGQPRHRTAGRGVSHPDGAAVMIGFNHLLLEQTLREQHAGTGALAGAFASAGAVLGLFPERVRRPADQPGDAAGRRRWRTATYMAFEGIWYAAHLCDRGLDHSGQRQSHPGGAAAGSGWCSTGIYVAYIAKRVGVASEKWSDARSLVTARVVDAYSNIET